MHAVSLSCVLLGFASSFGRERSPPGVVHVYLDVSLVCARHDVFVARDVTRRLQPANDARQTLLCPCDSLIGSLPTLRTCSAPRNNFRKQLSASHASEIGGSSLERFCRSKQILDPHRGRSTGYRTTGYRSYVISRWQRNGGISSVRSSFSLSDSHDTRE